MSLTHLWHSSIHGVPVIRDVFIETGTKAGDTLWEAKDLFADCCSIEINREVAQLARQRLKDYVPRVFVFDGDSRRILKDAIWPNRATTFFLDAHCEGAPSTVTADTECPLLDELRIIVAAPWTVKPLVIIDDVNMMNPEYWDDPASNHALFNPKDWPMLNEIAAIMRPQGYRYWEDPSGRIGAWA